jgi:hypothetical protein
MAELPHSPDKDNGSCGIRFSLLRVLLCCPQQLLVSRIQSIEEVFFRFIGLKVYILSDKFDRRVNISYERGFSARRNAHVLTVSSQGNRSVSDEIQVTVLPEPMSAITTRLGRQYELTSHG